LLEEIDRCGETEQQKKNTAMANICSASGRKNSKQEPIRLHMATIFRQ
jgi:hypothetical protein